MAAYDIVCGVPRSGRTFENFFTKLKKNHIDSPEDIDKLISIIKEGKINKSQSLEEAYCFLQESRKKSPNIGLFVDRKRENRPYRVGLLGVDLLINNLNVRIEGDEPHNCSSLVSLGEVDVAIAGLDELLTVTQSALKKPDKVTKWGMYNYNLPKERKLRIPGSAMLTRWNTNLSREVQDMVGFFLISKQKPKDKNSYRYPNDYLTHLEEHGDKIYVKGRYVDMIRSAYPYLNIVPVHDVEDAVEASQAGSVGLEIVQTGSTLKSKNLIILGPPLFLSESLYVVDYYNYLNNENLQKFLEDLQPVGYFDNERIFQFALWFYALEENIGDNWINKPSLIDLFCGAHESKNGLRPVRIKTRYWMSDDNYKIDEALSTVDNSKIKLQELYTEFKNGRL